jgi:hypothetical protein
MIASWIEQDWGICRVRAVARVSPRLRARVRGKLIARVALRARLIARPY